MSKSKKSTKIIEPTTTSELKESEMKSSRTKSKDESNKTSSMIQSIHCKNRDDREGQIIDIWNSNLGEAMSKIEDIIEKYPYIALVCDK